MYHYKYYIIYTDAFAANVDADRLQAAVRRHQLPGSAAEARIEPHGPVGYVVGAVHLVERRGQTRFR